MRRRALTIVLLLGAVLGWALAPASVSATPPQPASMAAAGDSITRAFNLCTFPFTDCPQRSWSTGSDSTVNSHARRLGITGSAFNDAVSGAKMADFPTQAAKIATRNVDYVTVLMGGNDVCTDSEAQMTDPGVYEAHFRNGMNSLASDPTPPLVFVVSIPNVKMLWEILKDSSSARRAWNTYNICQSLLANPLSTDQADVDRRERVKQRNMELNQRLRSACADYSFCRFDGEGVFGTPFTPSDVSTRDYFHPSTDGQKKLAAVSYDLGYWGTKGVNGAPTASFTPSCDGLTCTFTDSSTDPNGVTSWSWQFGDGRTSVAQHPSHTFSAAGDYTVTLYAIDSLGATSRVSQTLSVVADGSPPDENSAPSASFSSSCDGLTCSFTDTSTDSDGSVATWGWEFGDDATSTAQHPSHTYAAGGTYTVTLTVTDDDGATDSTSQSVSVSNGDGGGTATTMHVAALEGSGANVNRNFWRATVTITVRDDSGGAVEGATVSGSFSVGSGKSCTTSSAGTCSVTSDNLRRTTVSEVTYTVTGVTHATFVYDAGANLISAITIPRPS